jgi:hypothetical protein
VAVLQNFDNILRFRPTCFLRRISTTVHTLLQPPSDLHQNTLVSIHPMASRPKRQLHSTSQVAEKTPKDPRRTRSCDFCGREDLQSWYELEVLGQSFGSAEGRAAVDFSTNLCEHCLCSPCLVEQHNTRGSAPLKCPSTKPAKCILVLSRRK